VSAPLLLAALLSTAHAVEDTWIRPAGTDCDENGGQPIVGTAGFANARDALNTNIQTYSATAFADRALFRTHRHGDNAGSAAMEMNITWGATTVPTYNTRAIDHAVNTDNCTPDYLVAMRPIDLSATNIGFAYQWERFGLFYSASVAYGGVAYPHNYLRGMMYGLGLPMYSVYALAAAPLLRTGYQTQTGASAFALDWIGGATYHDEHLGVRVGYAGSAGLYGSVNEQNSGLYLSSVVRGQGALLSQLETGLDRLPGHKVAKGLGLTSVFLRDLPYGATAPTEDATRSLLPESGSLRTVHLEQDNLFRILDVHASQTLKPISQLHLAQLGLHTPGYHKGRNAAETGSEEFAGLVRAGLVRIPAQAAFGIEEGQLITFRAEGKLQFASGSNGSAHVQYGVLYNDAEQLAMYPYAQNVLTYRLQMRGEF